MKRKAIEAFALSLPGASLDYPFGADPVYKVAGKMFAIADGCAPNAQSGVGFKCSDLSFAILIERPGIIPSPYLARAKWVWLQDPEAMDDEEIMARLGEAHRLIVAKLPKKTRLEIDALAREPRKK